MPRRSGRRKGRNHDGSLGSPKYRKGGLDDPASLLGFRYDPIPSLHESSYASSYRHGRGRRSKPTPSFSRSDFVRANYRFIADYDGDEGARAASAVGLDSALPWSSVQAVLMFDADSPPTACPVCLDTPSVPRVTKCGHVYCFVCILRFIECVHAGGTASGRGSIADEDAEDLVDGAPVVPCPMCEAHVSASSLRAVQFSRVEPIAVGSEVTFTKLVRPVTSPVVLAAADTTTPRDGAIPFVHCLDPVSAPFVHIMAADPQSRVAALEADVAALTAAVAEFRSMGEPEFVPAASHALATVESQLELWRTRAASAAADANAVAAASAETGAETGKTMTVFQADSGQHVFLDMFSVRVLLEEYGSYAAIPNLVSGTIVDMAQLRQDASTRKRYKHLAHLPPSANFVLAEVRFAAGTVSGETKAKFASQIAGRAKKRKARVRRAERESARASKAREASWRTHISNPMPIYSADDFPAFDDEEEHPCLGSGAPPVTAAAPEPELGSDFVNVHHSYTDAIRGGATSNTVSFPALPSATSRTEPTAAASGPIWGARAAGSAPESQLLRPVPAAKGKRGKKGKKGKKQLLFTNSTTRGRH